MKTIPNPEFVDSKPPVSTQVLLHVTKYGYQNFIFTFLDNKYGELERVLNFLRTRLVNWLLYDISEHNREQKRK